MPLASAGKARGRGEPKSEDRPEPIGLRLWTRRSQHRSVRGIMEANGAFSEEERAAVYKCIFSRRDVRGEFMPDAIPDKVLANILRAAHHAPSVGFMQP